MANSNGQTRGHDGYGYSEVVVEERPLGQLFQELARDAGNLVNLELDLAKTEMAQKASQAGKDAGFIVAGGFVLYAGFLAIIAAVIVGLANVIPAWLSALIVGAVVAVVGYALVQKGMNDLKRRSFAPEQTIASLKQDKEWVQEQAK